MITRMVLFLFHLQLQARECNFLGLYIAGCSVFRRGGIQVFLPTRNEQHLYVHNSN